MKTGIIILAAGNSSRLGQPKQLLAYRGKTLLRLTMDAALASDFRPIIMVLGAYAGEISKRHSTPEITCVINENWEEGMSSSIAIGLEALLKQQADVGNAIISVADQAFINAGIFESLAKTHEAKGKNIVACAYAETKGTPTLFNKKYFEQLLSLTGNRGAKHIFEQHPEDLETIDFELGHIDIDTATDYINLINHT
ncbi:nucleotidyltransferase family protein [Pedobacter sp.]|uniref:nucleotidyltransferase family protein n=1 Tax=Pedobacter sp. TaxID=1411316 RepID=UPI003D7FADA6